MFKNLLIFKNFFLKKKIHKSINIHKNEIKTWNKLPVRFISCTNFQFEPIFLKKILIKFTKCIFLKKKKTSFLKLNKLFYKHTSYCNFVINFSTKLKYTKKYGIIKSTLKFDWFFYQKNEDSFNIFFQKCFFFKYKTFIFTKQKVKKKYIQKNNLVEWLPHFNFTYTQELFYKKNRKQYYFQVIILSSHLTNLWVNFIREYLRKYKLVKKLLYWSYIYKKCKFSQKKLISLLGDRLEKDEK